MPIGRAVLMADHIDPATIRGLVPDQTLVLLNGKRRHQSSLINVYGTRGRGNTGTDLNTIPAAAIERIGKYCETAQQPNTALMP